MASDARARTFLATLILASATVLIAMCAITTTAHAAGPITISGGGTYFSAEATSPYGAYVTYDEPTATDDDGDVPVICTPGSGSEFWIGPYSVVCVAYNGDDFQMTHVTVEVFDTTAPVFDGGTFLGSAEATGPDGAVVSYPVPTATDIADESVDVNCNPSSDSIFPLGPSSIECTASDDAGNLEIGYFEVEVYDTTSPSFTDVPFFEQYEATGPDGAEVDFVVPSATDIVDGDVTVGCDLSSGATYAIGTHIVNCDAIDSSGNPSSTNFSFEVVDSTPPSFSGVPASPVEFTATSPDGAVVDFDFLSVDDVADDNPDVQCTPSSGSLFAIGSTEVDCTATDASNNFASTQFEVQVNAQTRVSPMVSSGGEFTCALDTSGAVKCVGANNVGQLGPNGTAGSGQSSVTWLDVPLGGPARHIATGANHACAVLVTGELKCFGNNFRGALGITTGIGVSNVAGGLHAIPTPQTVDLGTDKAISVTAGPNFTCVLLDTGGVKCFGYNPNGELGNGAPLLNTSYPTPSAVDLGGVAATRIVASTVHVCAVLVTGNVACWGTNAQGQLMTTGDVNNNGHPDPVFTDFGGEAVDVAAGQFHTCVLLRDGTVQCAGANNVGQMTNVTAPASPGMLVPAVLSGPVKAIAAGSSHTCFVLESGSVECSGSNFFGQLGNSTNVSTFTPNLTPLPASFTGSVFQISAVLTHTCVVLTDGSIECVGSNGGGRLGRGFSGGTYTGAAPATFNLGDPTGPEFTGVPDDIEVEATSSSGRVVNYATPTAVDAVDGPVGVTCTPASGSTFAIATTTVTCVAEDAAGNESSESFDVTVEDTTGPTFSGVPTNFQSLASGPSGGTVNYSPPTANDAVDGSVTVECSPASGTLFSLGTTTVSCSAQDVAGNPATATFNVTVFEPADVTPMIVAGFQHTCTLSSEGLVHCFGKNNAGQVGSGGYATFTPTPVLLGGPAAEIAAGTYHSCVLMASGEVKCFGWNANGELGTSVGAGTSDPHPDPVTVDLGSDAVQSIAAGDNVSCAVLETGVLKCWGNNFTGQLGTGTSTSVPNPQPVVVDIGADATSVSIGTSHVCALLTSGDVACWGRNQHGELLTDTNFGTATINPPTIVDFGGEAVEVDAGGNVTCVRLESGEVRCGGRNTYGQLGTTAAYIAGTPVTADLPGPAAQLGLGLGHSCFVLANASAYCAGINSNGQLASAANLGSATAGQAAQLADFGGPVFQVAAGWTHTCAILTNGTVRCAGQNDSGQLGNSTNAGQSGSNPVALSTSQFLGDPVGPVFAGVPDAIVVEATGSSGAEVTFSAPTAEDAVDGPVSVDCSSSSGSTFAIGETVVTCDAVDAAGNATSVSFTVTVEDTTAPSFSGVPGPITVEATGPSGADVTYSPPTANDLVDGAVTVTCDPESGSTFVIATTQVTCAAEDSRGNEDTASFAVTVEDTTDPVFDPYPSFQSVSATGPTSPLGYTLPTATDIADDDVEVECTPEPTATYPIPDNAGVNEGVTCYATDESGNQARLDFSVFLADYTAPVLSGMPGNLTFEATDPAGAAVTYTPPTALDAVDGATAVSCSPTSGTHRSIGSHTVQCSSTDNSNNSVDENFQVQVVDTTAPTFNSQLTDITVEATGPLGTLVDISATGATDLVDGAVPVVCTPGTGQFAVGTTTVECSTADTRGNDAEYEFDVIVVDTTAPTMAGVPANISIPATSDAGAPVSYPLPTASDVVDGNVPVTCTPAPGSVFAIGTTTVACTATDAHGQSTSGSFTVTVQPQVIDLSETFRIVSAKVKRKNRLVVTVDVPAAGQLEVIATNRRPRSGAVASVLKPGPGRDKEGRAVLELEKSGRYAVTLRIDPRKAGLVKGKRNPLLRVTARFKLPSGEVKHRVIFVRLK